LTVTLPAFEMPVMVAANLPPPLFLSVPRMVPLAVAYAFSVAVTLVLVASTRSSRFELVYSARVIETVSAAGGGGGGTVVGLIVSVAVRLTPLYVAVMVAVVFAVTALVVMSAMLLCEPAGIVRVDGTLAAVLLLASETAAPPARRPRAERTPGRSGHRRRRSAAARTSSAPAWASGAGRTR
jgi:hypothetical protein